MESLAQGMLADSGLELGDYLVVATKCQLELEASLQRHQAKFLQTSPEVAREVGRKVGEKAPAPQRKCLVEPSESLLRVAGLREVDQGLEAFRVQLTRKCPQDIPGLFGVDGRGSAGRRAELPPQFGNMTLESVGRRGGRLLAPKQINEPITRYDTVCREEQDRKQGPLPFAG
jgi:hypothetical protein